MHKYYLEVYGEEHMLYASEIADLYNAKFNLLNTNKELTSRKVSSLIKTYCEKNNIEIQKLFFSTKYGIKRVYPFTIYDKVMNYFI